MAQSYSNLLELMKARRSVRSYDPTPVEKEKLDYIVEALRVAPSAKNIQPWHLVIVSEKNTIDKLVEACYAQSFIGQAPLVVAVVGDERIAYGRLGDFTSSLLADIGIAFEHLVLAAWEQGLGTCWIGKFKEPEVRNILGVPEGLRVIALTPLGYPSTSFVAKDRGRKSPNEIVHYEKF